MQPASVWIHFAVLIAAIVGANALRVEPASLFRVLYDWVPLIAGVSVAIQPANRTRVGTSIAVAATAALLMVALDVTGSFSGAPRSAGAFLMEGEIREMNDVSRADDASWVRTSLDWVRGDLPELSPHPGPYLSGDPRRKAVDALSEFGLVLLCFATTGIVLGVSSWLRRHARFDSGANEAGARIAVAWLVSAAAMTLAGAAVADRRFGVLFGGAPLWSTLTPAFGFLIIGAIGFVVAMRSDPGSSADHP